MTRVPSCRLTIPMMSLTFYYKAAKMNHWKHQTKLITRAVPAANCKRNAKFHSRLLLSSQKSVTGSNIIYFYLYLSSQKSNANRKRTYSYWREVSSSAILSLHRLTHKESFSGNLTYQITKFCSNRQCNNFTINRISWFVLMPVTKKKLNQLQNSVHRQGIEYLTPLTKKFITNFL